jgi:hypothetical protein
MEKNRRQSERISIPLEITLESASGNRECRISDLSMGGCFVDSIASVSSGEALIVILHLPIGRKLRLTGEVVYIYPGFGFGLRFLSLTDSEHDQLEQLILAHGGKPLLKELPDAGEAVPQTKEGTPGSESKTYNEFEEFIEDLLGNFEGDNKSV